MYEGHIRAIGAAERQSAADLRRFRWTDLVAKLAATRDFREEVARLEGGFVAFGEARRECQDTKLAINPDALSDGKSTALGSNDASDIPAIGDREI